MKKFLLFSIMCIILCLSHKITKAQYFYMNDTAGSYTTCGGRFYDSGGSSPYGSNEFSTLTFYPSNPSDKLSFSFSEFSTENGNDYLIAYDGPSLASPSFGNFNGGNGPLNGNILATNPQGAVTFRFISSQLVNSSGWYASINCINNSSVFYNMNQTSTPEVDTVCSGFFCDMGGLQGSYNNNSNYIHTFYPGTPNSSVQILFDFFLTQANSDGLQIFNGPDTTYPLISSNLPVGFDPVTCPAGAFSGNESPGIIKSTDVSGALTFVFKSTFVTNGPGWLGIISCVPNVGNFVYIDDLVTTHNTCDASFYDSGSINSNYGNNEIFQQTFVPNIPSNKISIEFGEIDIAAGDTLFVYQ